MFNTERVSNKMARNNVIFFIWMLSVVIGPAWCEKAKEICDCEYHDGGCVISVAPPSGFKCECKYELPLRCSGEAFPCVDNEHCPGTMADYCACKTGGGDCGGYIVPDTTCYGRSEPQIIASSSAECECTYHDTGCAVSRQAPFGWKCVCEEVGYKTCQGWAQGCAHKEVCLGYEHSYCACKQGGGNCDGYPEQSVDCLAFTGHERCDCAEKSLWSKGFYTVEKVEYYPDNVNILSVTSITLAEKFIPNKLDKPLTVDFFVERNMTFSSTFEHEEGLSLQRSLIFDAPFPKFNISRHTAAVPTTFEHVYGESTYEELPVGGRFTCRAEPFNQVVCIIKVQNGHLELPYTMTLKHKIIPDCSCKSAGMWKGLQPFNIEQDNENPLECNSNDCRYRAAIYLDEATGLGPL